MPRMKALAATIVMLIPACAQVQPQTIEQRLSAKEERLEQLYAEYWRAQYKNARGDKSASSIPVQKQIRELVAEPTFIAELRKATFSDPLLARRRKLFLEEAAYTLIFTDDKLAKLVEAMENDEASIEYEAGGKKLKRSELNNLLAHEPDREKRKQAWLARAKNQGLVGARIQQAMKMRKELAEKHAGGSFVDFMLERKGVPDRKRIVAIADEFDRATVSEYQKLMARIRRDLKIEKVEPWDIEYFFSTLVGDFETKKFPRDAAWPTIKQLALSLGYDFDKLPVDTVITEITFGGGTYPILYGKEVKILVNKYDGIRFTDTLLHESGHALHYTLMQDPTFILRGTSSEPFDEGCGQIMALMLYDKGLAKKFFGLTDAEHAAVAERYRLRTLLDTRETFAEARFEYAAYDDPDQDLATLYNNIYGETMGLDMHGAKVWAFNPFFSSGPIYIQSYAIAEMAARQIHGNVEASPRLNKWDKQTGDYLRERYFSISGRMTLDEILERGTGEKLSPKYTIMYANGEGPSAQAASK
jgi:oligoendopeptidase F